MKGRIAKPAKENEKDVPGLNYWKDVKTLVLVRQLLKFKKLLQVSVE